MDIEQVRAICIDLLGTTESFPFDKTTLVFKTGNKMFCLLSLDDKRVNLKAPPEEVIRLIELYDGIYPGYHMNKQHWITVDLEIFSKDSIIELLIHQSHHLIFESLPKKLQSELKMNC
ncbi:MAG: MmcQ/YjbR family DNA-binding protein [Bacteroidales bacterium]|nr:MmcQ/YjbR family DNA-binding protein [Bacteroidales bacterium]